MKFGVVLQNDPPAWRVVDLAKRAENYGFSHVWTFDSHLLWQEPYVVYSQILSNTHRITVGPMVTNPATRDCTVTASLFATLNSMFGNRTVCGIGRGDSAVRVINGKPVSLADLRNSVEVIRGLANGECVQYRGERLQLTWASGSRLPIWMAAYGPRALKLAGEIADGFILQLADPDIISWSAAAVRQAAVDAGRDPESITICVAAPAYVTDGTPASRQHGIDQCRWFGGMVGNHVSDIVRRYGGDGQAVPKALTDYIANREGYDYNSHGKAGASHVDFVSDEVVERFCLVGSTETQVARLRQLTELGVDQFALYLQHDGKDATLDAYGNTVIPAVNSRGSTRI
jgi:probable F420-dependent oxidoreductase